MVHVSKFGKNSAWVFLRLLRWTSLPQDSENQGTPKTVGRRMARYTGGTDSYSRRYQFCLWWDDLPTCWSSSPLQATDSIPSLGGVDKQACYDSVAVPPFPCNCEMTLSYDRICALWLQTCRPDHVLWHFTLPLLQTKNKKLAWFLESDVNKGNQAATPSFRVP